jgi:hypothetical protein
MYAIDPKSEERKTQNQVRMLGAERVDDSELQLV